MKSIQQQRLAEHEHVVKHDLARLNYPPTNWVKSLTGPDNNTLVDVLIVGSGMHGQTAAFALRREGISNIRVIDRNPYGKEGPWATYARMPTLRSPKQVNGPDLGIASLTFRAWYEAQHGNQAWDALYKIARLDWLDYLLWVRKMTGIHVDNQCSLQSLEVHKDFVAAQIDFRDKSETIYARRLVLAMGREGSGDAKRLPFKSLSQAQTHDPVRIYHSSDPIDFAALQGKRVAILGAGASAFDNAGTALESGAEVVTMFARRPHLPQVNKSKWSVFSGFMRGYANLDIKNRWRLYTYILSEQSPPPHESVLRCEQHAGFSIRFGEPWKDVQVNSTGVLITTNKATEQFDIAILATGFSIDIPARKELASIGNDISLWEDHVPKEWIKLNPEAGRFPFLGDAFELMPKKAGTRPGLEHIHLFNWGSTMSHGALSSDIPGMAVGATRLADGIVKSLFNEDIELHYQSMLDFEDPELAPTSYFIKRTERYIPEK